MSYAQTIANHMNCLWIKLDHDFHKKLDWVYFDLFLAITFVSLSKLQIIYQEVHSKCGSTIWQTINLNTIGFWKMLNYLIKGILWKVKNTLFEWHFSFYIKDYPLIHFTFIFMRKCDVLYSQLLSNLICNSCLHHFIVYDQFFSILMLHSHLRYSLLSSSVNSEYTWYFPLPLMPGKDVENVHKLDI